MTADEFKKEVFGMLTERELAYMLEVAHAFSSEVLRDYGFRAERFDSLAWYYCRCGDGLSNRALRRVKELRRHVRELFMIQRVAREQFKLDIGEEIGAKIFAGAVGPLADRYPEWFASFSSSFDIFQFSGSQWKLVGRLNSYDQMKAFLKGYDLACGDRCFLRIERGKRNES